MSAESENISNIEDKISYSVQLNASIALKLANIGDVFPTTITSGPLYGYLDVEKNDSIAITHTIAFPSFNTNQTDDFFNLRGSNSKFQQEFLNKLISNKFTVKLLGWFIVSTGNKFINSSIIDSLYHLNENFIKGNEKVPSLLIVYDHSKSNNGYLNLKCYKLSDSFLKTIKSENKFIAKNLIENKLSYKNILEEIPINIKSNHLTNLKLLDLDIDLDLNDNLSITTPVYDNLKLCSDQLNEAVGNFNHTLNNLSYFQRNLNRDITRIQKWESKIKQDNEEKLKQNPSAKVQSPDWRSEFKLLPPSSKYDYLIASSAVNNLCNGLETTENIEYVKSVGVCDSLSIN